MQARGSDAARADITRTISAITPTTMENFNHDIRSAICILVVVVVAVVALVCMDPEEESV